MLGKGEAKRGAQDEFKRLRDEEDALLFEAGFELVESDLLWVKECVYYGREAALQEARKAD
jgi:hypothetical protein